MKTHEEMIAGWKKDPAFRREYSALEQEFALFDELLRARQSAGLTQAEVAARMGTKALAVARLEAGGGANAYLLSVSTLRKYAQATGCQLEIKLVPKGRQAPERGPSNKRRPGQEDRYSRGT